MRTVQLTLARQPEIEAMRDKYQAILDRKRD